MTAWENESNVTLFLLWNDTFKTLRDVRYIYLTMLPRIDVT